MTDPIDTLELKDFLELVDGIIDGIESGEITSNPLIALKEIPIIERLNDKEESINSAMKVDTVNTVVEPEESEEKLVLKRDDVLGKWMLTDCVLVVEDTDTECLYFGNNKVAASAMGVGPATAKNRAKKNATDPFGNKWYYKSASIVD